MPTETQNQNCLGRNRKRGQEAALDTKKCFWAKDNEREVGESTGLSAARTHSYMIRATPPGDARESQIRPDRPDP